MFYDKTIRLLQEINEKTENQSEDSKLPGNVYYLDDGSILCTARSDGESRFPYDADGYTLWAHSSGHIHVKSGGFNVLRPIHDDPEPAIHFFAGIKQEDGYYFPISLLGGTQQLFEPYHVKRYVVYTLSAAYYITDTDVATFAVRTDVSKRKEVRLSVGCINKKGEPLQMCLTSYIDPFLREGEQDNMWSKNRLNSRYMGDGSFILSSNGGGCKYAALVVNRKVSDVDVEKTYHTTSKIDFLGYTDRRVYNAECLKTGAMDTQSDYGSKRTTEIAGEIIHVTVNDKARIDYVLPFSSVSKETEQLVHQNLDVTAIDKEIQEKLSAEQNRIGNLNIQFSDWNSEKINANVLNKFLKNVQKQVDMCAMGKSYVEYKLGTRDVFQQLEQALIWDSAQAREKMLRAISYIDPSGRAPRQFSIVDDPDVMPQMDLREFVDQGNWILSCFYSYLAWTNDLSILNEDCGYYEIIGNNAVKRSEMTDSALTHLIRIADYLESKLDKEGTGCLRILFGDWNDAIDGLGRTTDVSKDFGSGVSVMASLHYYQNLHELSQILKAVGGYEEQIRHYEEVRRQLSKSIVKHVIVENETGEKRLIHGWGDKKSYLVGSFCDSDGKSRISFAPNAFWVSSGLIYETQELKEVILHAIHSLDSRFGLKTLIPAFSKDSPGVGRIANTTPGTAENDCAYCHASMFSVMALFLLGDAEFAWKQLEKTMPISHKYISKSPFVMSNSYLDNSEEGFDGESAIDWYTGSGTVLIKNFVRYGLGIQPVLDGLVIQMPSKMPCNEVQAEVTIKGCRVYIIYKNQEQGRRNIYFNGKELNVEYDELMETWKAFIPNNELQKEVKILVND